MTPQHPKAGHGQVHHHDHQAGEQVTYPPYAAERSQPEHQHSATPDHRPRHGHGGHGLMMLLCCIPMIVIAVALVATGVAGSGAIVGALLCTLMMAAIMFMMPGGHGGHGHK